ncbi:transglutaminase family protein [Fusibacter ferrireducens]|uniref:Transglutaminase domain-containing protein n=1 Tax=Fusibacter ferrireducens TaxID=2785058 RepID=A0ABR9ZYE5_9FIRM|nr:transglutaminase domain-containing protein [Fusibacter ferrireducens]MBF4695485.1 transglutaminase domain-containing protein [Fusibacter ferrireducens]
MSRKYQWLAGFIIYGALLMLMNHFVNYALNSTQFICLAIVSYTLCIVFILYRKWLARICTVAFLCVLFIYALDAALEHLFVDEMTLRNDLIVSTEQEMDLENQPVDATLETEAPASGFTVYQNVHRIRQDLDYQKIINFVKWLTESRGNHKSVDDERYERILFVGMSFTLALILQLIMRYRYSKVLLLIPFFAFVWMWYQYVDLPRRIYAYYFIGVFIFYVLDRQNSLKKRSQDYGRDYYKSRALFQFSAGIGLLMILVTIVVTTVFPIKKFNQLTEPIIPHIWGGRSGYSSGHIKMYTLNDTAYQSSDNQLGGPIKSIDRDTPLFWVKMDQKQSKSLYLKGNVKDYYDGYQWFSHANTYKKAFEFYLSEPRNVDYLNSVLFEEVSGTIRFDHMDTITLFSPMGLYNTSLGEDVFVSIDNEAFYKAGAFVKFLETYHFNSANKDFLLSKEVDYLQLPDNIDRGIYQLARNLGAYGKTSDEKMLIMTRFLLQNYQYTLNPPKFDRDREFVSKFLLDTREGYCTYFATALTVMARINGMPARYVEGFRIDPNEENSQDYSMVTEGDAHAWCEVYLEDRGWVIFESTPPYADLQLSSEQSESVHLDQMLEKEETTIVSASNLDREAFKENLQEEQMNFGDTGDDSGLVQVENRQKQELDLSLVLMGSILTLISILLIAVVVSYVINMSKIRANGTRKNALRMTYYLAYLLRALHPNQGVLLDHLIVETQLEDEAQMKILTFIYNNRADADVVFVNEVSSLLSKAIEQQELKFKLKFGWLKLARIKIFNLRKIVL